MKENRKSFTGPVEMDRIKKLQIGKYYELQKISLFSRHKDMKSLT